MKQSHGGKKELFSSTCADLGQPTSSVGKGGEYRVSTVPNFSHGCNIELRSEYRTSVKTIFRKNETK